MEISIPQIRLRELQQISVGNEEGRAPDPEANARCNGTRIDGKPNIESSQLLSPQHAPCNRLSTKKYELGTQMQGLGTQHAYY